MAAAMIDRIVRHGDMLRLKAASYPLRKLGIDTPASGRTGAGDRDTSSRR